MDDRLKKAFGEIRAEKELKETTKNYIAYTLEKKHTKHAFPTKHIIPAAAFCFLLLLGIYGFGTFFIPVSTISVDINPSVELGLNRFDKVISVHAFNDDGKALADTLDVQYMNYTDAIHSILEAASDGQDSGKDPIVSITVVSSQDDTANKLMEGVQECTSGQENVYCYASSPEEVEQAHSLGLSYGKYRAFLELQELDPSITTEEIQGMTMREIRDMINGLSDAHTSESSGQTTETGNGHGDGNGQNSGNGQGSGNGQNSGNGQGSRQHKGQA